MDKSVRSRIYEAHSTIESCMGSNGCYRPSGDRSCQQQYRTRDIVFSGWHYLLCIGQQARIVPQLLEIAKRIPESGYVPLGWRDDSKISSPLTQTNQNMLQFERSQQISDESSQDVNLLFIVCVQETLLTVKMDFADAMIIQDASRRVMKHVTSVLENNLVRGADQRESRENMKERLLLSNACLLYYVYDLIQDYTSARVVQELINTDFWTGEYFEDYPGSQGAFDMFGNILVVLYRITSQERLRKTVISCFTKRGAICVVEQVKNFPFRDATEQLVLARDGCIILPWLICFLALACTEVGMKSEAERLFTEWMTSLEGFNEWYSVEDRKAYGRRFCLSSAVFLVLLDRSLNGTVYDAMSQFNLRFAGVKI